MRSDEQARTAVGSVVVLDDALNHLLHVHADAVVRPAPLMLRASRRLRAGQRVQRDEQALHGREAPVAAGLLITVYAEDACKLLQLCLCEARQGEARLRPLHRQLHALTLRMQAGLLVAVVC